MFPGILTFLAISSQTQSFNAELPKVSYIKAIDVWMFVCNLFVFLSLMEYAFAQVFVLTVRNIIIPSQGPFATRGEKNRIYARSTGVNGQRHSKYAESAQKPREWASDAKVGLVHNTTLIKLY